MKLATYSPLPSGNPRPGLVTGANRVIEMPTALGAGESTATMLGLIRAGAPMLEKLRALEKSSAASAALADVRLHAPIPRPVKNVFCVGWNYLEHFEEGAKKLQEKRELPQHPVFFSKATTPVNRPFDNAPFAPSRSTSPPAETDLAPIIAPRP